MRKYTLTNEVIIHNGHRLHRIRALKSFVNVKKGDLGGFVEKERNLSQENDASWVYDNAKVYDCAIVCDNAKVLDEAEIFDSAVVCHNAWVIKNAKVFQHATILGDAVVSKNAKVFGTARIFDKAYIDDNAEVSGGAEVCGASLVEDNSVIKANTKITIGTYMDACIETPEMYVSISPFCAEQIPYAVFYKTTNKGICVSTPNFLGCVKDFVTFIKKNIKDAADKEKCLERLQVVNENYCKKFK